MAHFDPHLHFSGNTEDAFNFYKSVFGGEFTKLVRYKDLPQSADYKIPENYLNKIMQMALPIGKATVLMGADAIESMGQKLTIGDNFTISIRADSKEEADKLFNGLSIDGKIEMPIADSPGNPYFGMLADKFGIQWWVSFDPNFSGSGLDIQ